MVAEGELPGLGELRVGAGGEGGAAVGGVGVEGGEGVLAGGEGLVGPVWLGVGHVHAGGGEDGFAEDGQRGDVHGEFAERHGLVVTLEVGIVFGDALEDAAGHGDFDVVVLEEEFSGGHGFPFGWRGEVVRGANTEILASQE